MISGISSQEAATAIAGQLTAANLNEQFQAQVLLPPLPSSVKKGVAIGRADDYAEEGSPL